MSAYRVISPYVTVPVRDEATGTETVYGFYKDAVLPANTLTKAADALVKRGYLEKVKDAAASEPASRKQSEPGAAPSGRASRDEWAAYATGKGAPSEETRTVEEGGLSRDDLRAKYGG